MFHPKTVPMGNKTFDQDTATLREYFDLDDADMTIPYYGKQVHFHAWNVHDLRVQLQTAKDFLELVTCPNSIATQGFNYILEPTRWRKMSTLIHDRFQTEQGFGSKFLYSIDCAVQIFLDRVATTWDDKGQPNYLLFKAQELVDKVEDGLILKVTLPKVLMVAGTEKKDAKEPNARKARPSTPISESTRKVSFYTHPSEVHTNSNVHAPWKVPDTKNFLDFFKDRSPSSKPWPRFTDPRIPRKNRRARVVPLCARFQVTGKCTQGCGLAHVNANKMSETDFQAVNKIIVAAYAAKSKA